MGDRQLRIRAVDPFADAPEPPDCETLDAGAAAAAAGIDVDVTDLDGSADVSLPGFWTKSCSYGNGAMSLSTLSFTTLENAQQFYADNLDITQGVVLDVALGSLPESSLVIQTGVAVEVDGSVPSTEATGGNGTAGSASRRVRGAGPVLRVVHWRRHRSVGRDRRRRGVVRCPVWQRNRQRPL